MLFENLFIYSEFKKIMKISSIDLQKDKDFICYHGRIFIFENCFKEHSFFEIRRFVRSCTSRKTKYSNRILFCASSSNLLVPLSCCIYASRLTDYDGFKMFDDRWLTVPLIDGVLCVPTCLYERL